MRYLSLVICCSIFCHLEAQLVPTGKIWDIGQISEDSLIITHSFFIKNEDELLLQIDTVYEDCNCSIISWPRSPLSPGAEALLKVAYEIRNRLGSFEKVFKVIGNTGAYEQQFILKGEVVPGRAQAKKQYPVRKGRLQMLSDVLHFEEVTSTYLRPRSFFIYNASEDTLYFDTDTLPLHLEISFLPPRLEPGAVGRWSITYAPDRRTTLGYLLDEIAVEVSGAGQTTQLKCFVAATQNKALDDIKGTSAVLVGDSGEAVLSFQQEVYDFGLVRPEEALLAIFAFRNTGAARLEIKQVDVSADYIYLQDGKRSYEPKEEGEFMLLVDARALKRGKYNERIEVYTNDPNSPVQTLRIHLRIDKK